MSTGSTGFSLRPLASPDDWAAWRAELEPLEAAARPSPWAGWTYWEACARLLGHHDCWALEARQGDRLAGATVLRGETVRRRGLALRTLRAFDQVSFMRVPAFLALPGQEAAAAGALADAWLEAARRARADLVTLFRQDRATCEPLADALAARGPVLRRSTWTHAAQILLPDDLDGHLKAYRANLVRNVERTRRKLSRDERAEPGLELLDCAALSPEAWTATRARFDALDRRTWQHDWEARSERVDLDRTRAFDAACRELWRSRGWLHLAFLTLPSAAGAPRDLALAVSLSLPDRVWVVRVGYDPAFRAYSPGGALLLELLRTGHARGARVFELGGEVLGWKKRWADAYEDVRRLEWGGPTWKGRLWSLAQRVRPSTPRPVGEAPPAARDPT